MAKLKPAEKLNNVTLERVTRPCPADDKSRVRNWSVLVWVDSAPPDWREYLDEQAIEWIESPLHDKDINADGTPKKPHWHLLLMFGGKKSYDQVVEFTKYLNTTIPQRCHSAKGLIRYMAHLDNPEKAQYPAEQIISHGGVDIQDLLKVSYSQRLYYMREMQHYIEQENIVDFDVFSSYCLENQPDDWYTILTQYSTTYFRALITARRCRQRDSKQLSEPAYAYLLGLIKEKDEQHKQEMKALEERLRAEYGK